MKIKIEYDIIKQRIIPANIIGEAITVVLLFFSFIF